MICPRKSHRSKLIYLCCAFLFLFSSLASLFLFTPSASALPISPFSFDVWGSGGNSGFNTTTGLKADTSYTINHVDGQGAFNQLCFTHPETATSTRHRFYHLTFSVAIISADNDMLHDEYSQPLTGNSYFNIISDQVTVTTADYTSPDWYINASVSPVGYTSGKVFTHSIIGYVPQNVDMTVSRNLCLYGDVLGIMFGSNKQYFYMFSNFQWQRTVMEQEDLNIISNSLSSIKTGIDTLQTLAGTTNSKLTSINSDTSKIYTDVEEIKTYVKNIYTKVSNAVTYLISIDNSASHISSTLDDVSTTLDTVATRFLETTSPHITSIDAKMTTLLNQSANLGTQAHNDSKNEQKAINDLNSQQQADRKQDQKAVTDQQTATDTQSNQGTQEASEQGTTLLKAFIDFVAIIVGASPSDCVFDMDLGTVDFGLVDICSVSPPSALVAVGTIMAMVLIVRLSIASVHVALSLYKEIFE